MPEIVRWGIIGCGNIARNAVCPAINWAAGSRLVAIGSRDGEKARMLAGELGAEKHMASYEAVVSDPDVDAIYIGLPNGFHEEWTIRALENGKHVLCEKSLTMDDASARRMEEMSIRKGRRLMEAYMYRHHPQWEVVRGLLGEGAIGQVRLLRAGLMGDLSGDMENHRWSTKLGGGALFDVTCYGVNVARFLLGEEPVGCKSSADLVAPHVDRSSSAILTFRSGTTAIVAGSLVTYGNQFCDIIGTTGSIHVEKPFIPSWNPVSIRVKRNGGMEDIEVGGANHYLHMVEHFSRCVLDETRPLTPGETGVAQTRALTMIEQAFQAP
ncbi:MAG: Gfo/Idh/MocA family oxidoreductase [Candidatus Sumerlaeia bacterium]|nr:Gfo/Idh/MocA family oxidoreductase [Candidatus Sumerlaeia bacterium]